MSIDELLKAVTQLNETDLDQLLHQVVVLRASRKTQVLPEKEAELLQAINQGIPIDLRTCYQQLRQRRDAETLTEMEYDTLIQLSNQIEQIGAQRLEALANLAQLRQVSLLDLMETLGIQPVSYA
jgi:kynurenine formamidase